MGCYLHVEMGGKEHTSRGYHGPVLFANDFYGIVCIMEQDLLQKLEVLEKALQEQTRLVRQMRTYFLWTLIVSVGVVILPLIGLLFLIPQFIGLYENLGI